MDVTKVICLILIFFRALTGSSGGTNIDADSPKNIPSNNNNTQEAQTGTVLDAKNDTKSAEVNASKPTEDVIAPTGKKCTGYWVFDQKNETCIIIMQLHLKLSLTYTTKDNKTSTRSYNIQPNGEFKVTNGSCGTTNQSFTVQDPTSETTFSFKSESSKFMLSAISVKVTDGEDHQKFTLNYEFKTPIDTSYQCDREIAIDFKSLSEGNKEVVAYGTISHVQLEAFRKGNECQTNTSGLDDIYIMLIVLSVIFSAVIGYVIGRNNSQVGSLFSKRKCAGK